MVSAASPPTATLTTRESTLLTEARSASARFCIVATFIFIHKRCVFSGNLLAALTVIRQLQPTFRPYPVYGPGDPGILIAGNISHSGCPSARGGIPAYFPTQKHIHLFSPDQFALKRNEDPWAIKLHQISMTRPSNNSSSEIRTSAGANHGQLCLNQCASLQEVCPEYNTWKLLPLPPRSTNASPERRATVRIMKT